MALKVWVALTAPLAMHSMAVSYSAPEWPMATFTRAAMSRTMAGTPSTSGLTVMYLTAPSPAASYLAKSSAEPFCSRCSGIAPLYWLARKGPSRCTPRSCAQPPASFMAALAWSRHQRVCSGVSVSTLHSQPVVPWLAKKWPMVPLSCSAVAAFTSTPAAPWVWMSMKPGTRRLPPKSSRGQPAGAFTFSASWATRPSST